MVSSLITLGQELFQLVLVKPNVDKGSKPVANHLVDGGGKKTTEILIESVLGVHL